MLLNSFFLTSNATLQNGDVIVNLTGASKHEANTIYPAGKYKIEIAPGGYCSSGNPGVINAFGGTYLSITEAIDVPFIVRAYCGGNGSNGNVGINLYSGYFKVNGAINDTQSDGIDVAHIFGAGGGNARTSGIYGVQFRAGGNCLGNGSVTHNTFGGTDLYYGGGSCLHLLPVGGIFGTDYIRAYHTAPYSGICGGAYGGGAAGPMGDGVTWSYRGGNSPYGLGGTTNRAKGGGIGGGGTPVQYVNSYGNTVTAYVAGGAYFNGTTWIDKPGSPNNTILSLIKITYLGPS